MIVDLGQEKLCDRCDGKSVVAVDDSGEQPDFYRFCKCIGRIPLTDEELGLAKSTWELRKASLASMSACGGWPAAGD
jgi:hypothetical protein